MNHLRLSFLIPLLLSSLLPQLLHAQCTTTITSFPYLETFDGADSMAGWSTGVIPSPNPANNSWSCRNPSIPKIPTTGPVPGVTYLPVGSVAAMTVINHSFTNNNCWVTGWNYTQAGTTPANVQRGTYFSGERSYVMSPCFDFTGLTNPTFAAMVWWDIDEGDRVYVEVSVNNGSWVRLGNHKSSACGWYNWNDSLTSTANPKPSPTTFGWRGKTLTGAPPLGSGGWQRVQHSLKQYAGQSNVRLRFALFADASKQGNGFAFDNVQIKDIPSLDLMPGYSPNSRILCYGDTVTFNVTPIIGSTGFCTWYTKPNNVGYNGSHNPILKVVDKAWYKVKAYDDSTGYGFCYVDSAYVNANTLVVYLGNDTVLCPGGSVTLNGGSGTTYLWRRDSLNTPVISNSPSFTTNQSGTYLETIIHQGCTLTEDINVAFEQVPDVNLGIDTVAICAGQSYQLNAGNAPLGTRYDWFFNSVPAFSSQAIFVSSPGWYKALITTPAAACQDSDSMYLQVNLPPVTDLGQNRFVCSPETLQVATGANITYVWTPVAYGTGSSAVFVPVKGQPGQTITVSATDELGCTSKDTVTLTPGTDPDASLGPDKVLCAGSSLVLTPVNANLSSSTYLWSNGQKTSSIIVTTPGIYWVEITNPGGCNDLDQIQVTVDPLRVNIGSDTVLCDGSTLTLKATTANSNVNYVWNTTPPQTTSAIAVTQPGTYAVTATNASGCIDQDTISVAGLPALLANFSFPTNANNEVTLYAPIQFTNLSATGVTSWHWHFGNGPTDVATVANPSHAFVALGTFTVTLTVSDGICTSTITKQVTVVLPVDADAEKHIGIAIAPNPSNGRFTLELTQQTASEVTLSLIAADGRAAWTSTAMAAETQTIHADATALNPGIYVLKVETGAGTIYRKIVIN